MKICVATNVGGLEDQVSPVFGRCGAFTLVDVEGRDIKNVEVLKNGFAAAAGGAGIQAAQFIVNNEVKVVIAGNYGPNAFPILRGSNVEAVTIQGVSAKDAVMKYLNGELNAIEQPTAQEHWGMSGGMGRGGGGRRGMSGGRGMGVGRGMMNIPPQPPTQQTQTREQEIQSLEQQTKVLEQELNDARKRIDELKKEE